MRAPRGLVWQGLCVLAAAALCLALGTWQVRRLGWKEALIAEIESRAGAAPSELPASARWAALKASDYGSQHVRAVGTFDLSHVALVFTPAPDGGVGSEPGFFALVPLRLGSGGVVIVNRGFTPQSKAAAGAWRTAPAGETRVEGWLREPQRRNYFTPDDDPAKDKWFTADPARIAAAFGIEAPAPFLLEQQAGPPQDGLVRPAAIDTAQIPNNHLGYALTWFGLALVMTLVFAVYAKGRLN